MGIRIGAGDVLWGYAGTFIRFGASLLVLPLALRLIPSHELGVWYVFQTLNALVALIDNGFSSTLNRNVAYSWAGVKKLSKIGIPESFNSRPNVFLLLNLIRESKRIYLILSVSILSLASISGSIYIVKISEGEVSIDYVIIAWVLFLISLFVNLLFSYWNALLTGLGLVKQYQKANVISGLLYVVVANVGLFTGYGLIAMSLAMLVNGLSIRFLCHRSFVAFTNNNGIDSRGYKKIRQYKGISEVLWHNAKKLSITSLGNYLAVQFNLFFLPIFIDLSAAAVYGLCIQVMRLLIQFGNVPMSSSYAEISSLRAEKRKERLASKISVLYAMGFSIVIGGSLSILFFGNLLLKIINSKTMLPAMNLLFVIALMIILEWSTAFTNAIINTGNKIPYMRSSLISGLLISMTTFILLKYSNLGLWGVVLPQFLIQMVYNYWRWHVWLLRDLDMGYIQMLKSGSKGLWKLLMKYYRRFLDGKNTGFRK